jgi:hypothetical protein
MTKKMLRIKIHFVRDSRFFISHAFGLSSWCFFKVGRGVEEGGGKTDQERRNPWLM